MDRRPRPDCRQSFDAGGIGPVTFEVNWMFSSGQFQADMMIMMSADSIAVDIRFSVVCFIFSSYKSHIQEKDNV